MKTKDAFALADFDKDRILSRAFFDRFKKIEFRSTLNPEPLKMLRISNKELTDDEVLKEYLQSETIGEKEFYYQQLRYICSIVSLYHKHVEKHSLLLTELYKAIMVDLGSAIFKSTEGELTTASQESDFQSIKSKIKRLETLNHKYTDILRNILHLQKKFLNYIEEIKADVESVYVKNFAKNLKLARKATGYKQETFARLLGLARTDIAQFESGRKTPSFLSLCRIVNSPFVDPNILKVQ